MIGEAEAKLAVEYQKFCSRHGYPQASADELLEELREDENAKEEHLEYLERFILRYDEVMAHEFALSLSFGYERENRSAA